MNSLQIARRSRFPAAGLLTVLLLGAIAGAVAAGCASSAGGGATGYEPGPGQTATASHETLMAHGMPMSAADMDAAWAARPAYVETADPATREAYAFSLSRPDALQYMPCYCGCVAMDHRSNLDCFLKPRQAGMAISFEEHASFCGPCIETALMTKRMLAAGSSFAEIRAAVDAEFIDVGAPGTVTDLPPS